VTITESTKAWWVEGHGQALLHNGELTLAAVQAAVVISAIICRAQIGIWFVQGTADPFSMALI